MTTVNNCNLPEDLYYVVGKHVWARHDGELVTVGMTDVAQNLAKTIVAVTPKATGKAVQKGRNITTVESGKWVAAVLRPDERRDRRRRQGARRLARSHQLGPVRGRLGRPVAPIGLGSEFRRSRDRARGHRGVPPVPRRRGHYVRLTRS